MSVDLQVKGSLLSGEIALVIPPGTTADACGRALDEQLANPLADVAAEMGLVLAASPSKFAKPLPGKDSDGRTKYAIRGRAEGGRLVPSHGLPDKKHGKRDR